MKNLKSILFSAVLLLTITAHAQKEEKAKAEYDKKTGLVTVNGTTPDSGASMPRSFVRLRTCALSKTNGTSTLR